MIEVNDFPPNIADIQRIFPEVVRRRDVIFTYGDTIYNPGGFEITVPLRAHEGVHSQRQGKEEPLIIGWWRNYLTDPDFRFREELPAHRAEYKAYCQHEKSRERRVRYLHDISIRLAGPLYGRLVSHAEAKAKILA